MSKVKTTYYYLERGFPENLEPASTDGSTKHKRFLIERKKWILKRAIRKSLRTLVKPLFSAPTRKGILLEKSEDSSQHLFSRERGSPFKKSQDFRDTYTKTTFNRVKSQVFGEARRSPSQSKCKRYKFLFPLYRLKGELSKRESQYGKIELYKKQIQEKKKLAFIYGTMSKSSIRKLVIRARALSFMGKRLCPSRGLVTLLESRLDVALFRASFFPSIPMARQWINHNRVIVNKRGVRSPGYQLKGGDCIEILPQSILSLKESQRRRVAKILPFRRSRKKLITPSIMRNWCSFESMFPGEEKILPTPTTIRDFSLMRDHLKSVWEKSAHSQPFTGAGSSFSAGLQISRISSPPATQSEANHQILPNSVEPLNPLSQGAPFSLGLNQETPPLFHQSGLFSPKRRNQRNQKKISDQRRQKRRTSSTEIHSALRKGVTLFNRLAKRKLEHLDFLNAKQALIRPRNRMQKLAGLRISAIKPLHLEISYRLLTAIFLYSPQKVAYPASLDLPLIMSLFK